MFNVHQVFGVTQKEVLAILSSGIVATQKEAPFQTIVGGGGVGPTATGADPRRELVPVVEVVDLVPGSIPKRVQYANCG